VSEMMRNRDSQEGLQVRLTYTIPEACLIIGISRTTLWKAIRTGKLSCYKIGRRILFSEEHMTGFLKLNEKAGKSRSRG
jgi:excisionase family DNA binding protein